MWPRFLIDHIFFRKRHWYLISEWNLGLVNALNHHVTGVKPAYYLKLFWIIRCPVISFSRILCMGPVLYPEEMYGIVGYLIFAMSFYVTFKKKNFSMWITRGSYMGHIRNALWVKWVNRYDPLPTLIAIAMWWLYTYMLFLLGFLH